MRATSPGSRRKQWVSAVSRSPSHLEQSEEPQAVQCASLASIKRCVTPALDDTSSTSAPPAPTRQAQQVSLHASPSPSPPRLVARCGLHASVSSCATETASISATGQPAVLQSILRQDSNDASERFRHDKRPPLPSATSPEGTRKFIVRRPTSEQQPRVRRGASGHGSPRLVGSQVPRSANASPSTQDEGDTPCAASDACPRLQAAR